MTVRKERKYIEANQWWACARDAFTKVVTEYLQKAKNEEFRALGHECGHLFHLEAFVAQDHSSVVGDPEHHDAPERADAADILSFSIDVRAHNLRDALLVAATIPLQFWDQSWPDDEETDEDHT